MLSPPSKLFSFKHSKLSTRLLIYVVVCSSVFALLVSAFQLYLDYRKDVSNIHDSIELIHESYLEPIETSAYSMDQVQLDSILQGLLKIRDIAYLEVSETHEGIKTILAVQGDRTLGQDIQREFKLDYPFHSAQGGEQHFATLHIGASFQGIYRQLTNKALIILASNFLKTFIASFFIYFIFQFCITRHLVHMAKFARKIDLENLTQPLALERSEPISTSDDELDQLVGSINAMQQKMAKEVAERKLVSEVLNHHASHDSLTGLLNRREFEVRAEELFDSIQEDKSEHVFCFMDLDQFKVVNDTCGHIAGDELLRQIAQLLKSQIKEVDALMRLGGDEFGILIKNCSLEEGMQVAEKVLESMKRYQFLWENRSFKVGISIGLVLITESNASLIELLRDADRACYLAKDLSGNRIHIHRPDNIEETKRRNEMQWAATLNECLQEGRFCLFSQPIEPMNNQNTRHYEVLVRMIDKTGKIFSPGTFMPAAERYNLASSLDCWVVENVFKFIADNKEIQQNIELFMINLSGQSIGSEEMHTAIFDLIERYSINAKKICFEITETSAIANLSMAIKFMDRLKDFGCKFALDDFGSGLSSFGYLKNLPVDFLKIDGMFTKNIVNDSIDAGIVKSINEIAQSLGIKTIAEHVEDETSRDLLADIGVDYIQGYLIEKPQLIWRLLTIKRNESSTKNHREVKQVNITPAPDKKTQHQSRN